VTRPLNLVGCSSNYIIYTDDTAQSEPLPVENKYSRRKGVGWALQACMGWSWAAACDVQGRGILRGFPHCLLR